MSGPPAAVISPPAMDGEPPSPVTKPRALPSPSLGGMTSVPPDPLSSTAPELSPADPKSLALDFAHAGIITPSARVKGRARGRVNHRMTNPPRTDGAHAFVQAMTYHASLEMRPPKVVYLYGLPSRLLERELTAPLLGSTGCTR